MTQWHVVMTVTGPRPEAPEYVAPNTYNWGATQTTIHGVREAETRHEAFEYFLDKAVKLFQSEKVGVNFLSIEPDRP